MESFYNLLHFYIESFKCIEYLALAYLAQSRIIRALNADSTLGELVHSWFFDVNTFHITSIPLLPKSEPLQQKRYNQDINLFLGKLQQHSQVTKITIVFCIEKSSQYFYNEISIKYEVNCFIFFSV